MASGCVLSDPPEYGTVKQTPPFLQLDKAIPSTYFLNEVDRGAQQPRITVDVRSEDAGEPLEAVVFWDYDPKLVNEDGGSSAKVVGTKDILPATLEESRTFNVLWSPLDEGCHQVTMIVTHASNLDENKIPIDREDVATATWWFKVVNSDVTTQPPPIDIDDCPKPTAGSN